MIRCDCQRFARVLGLVLATMVAVNLGGCYSRREIELTGFILAIGLDRGEESPVRLVCQLAVPAAIAGESNGGKASEERFVLLKAEGDTVSEAIQELSMVAPDRLFWGHADIVLMTPEALEGGLDRVSDILLREREFRPGARLYVTDQRLEELLSVEFPTQPGNASYIDRLSERRSSHSMSPQATVKDLGCASVSATCALLVPVLRLDSSSVAGKQGTDGKVLRLEGSGVVGAAGLVGELTGPETRGALWILGEVGETSISLKDPDGIKGLAGIRVLRSWSEVGVTVGQERVEDSVVTVVVRGEADVIEISGAELYQNIEDLGRINAALNDAVLNEIHATLSKTRDMGADIFGFSERFRQSMAADRWREAQGRWSEVFPELHIAVEVDIRVRRRGMVAWQERFG